MPFNYAPVGQGVGRIHHIKATYSFATHGGAQGTITVADDVIPQGAAILAAYMEVNTVFTSGGAATVALTTGQGAGDIQAAAAIAGAPWSTTGWKLSSARTFAAAPLETSAARDVAVVIATADLTAGAADVHVFFIVP